MKINLIKKTILNNKLLILLFVILISCDSVGDSNDGSMNDTMPDNPTMQPAPTVSPTLQPPGAPPIIPPTPQPTTLPTLSPDPIPVQPLNEFQSLLLSLVNGARAEARNCGSEFSPAAPPVNWDIRIEDAALAHSLDMAQNQNFSHTGTDGSDAGDRLLMQGYDWSTWGENILVGLDDATDAVDAWIGSSGHCSILMSPSLKEVGAGVAQGIFQGNSASYWTLVFATES
jgi:uncharacterized protein YkwD